MPQSQPEAQYKISYIILIGYPDNQKEGTVQMQGLQC